MHLELNFSPSGINRETYVGSNRPAFHQMWLCNFGAVFCTYQNMQNKQYYENRAIKNKLLDPDGFFSIIHVAWCKSNAGELTEIVLKVLQELNWKFSSDYFPASNCAGRDVCCKVELNKISPKHFCLLACILFFSHSPVPHDHDSLETWWIIFQTF